MSSIQPVPVSIAGPRMAAALKKSWERQREEVMVVLNEYRNLLYNLYSTHPLFSNVFHCICVSEFSEPCVNPCVTSGRYLGFSVPAGVAGVEAIFDYGQPLTLRSRWRETMTGIPGGCGGRLDALEMAKQFPTERDLDSIIPLKVRADVACDAGKLVVVNVLDSDFKTRTLEFKLVADEWQYVTDVHVREILSVALPPGRRGEVTLSQSDGRELSIYQPSESSPAYRRFKVPDRCRSRSVIVQGNRSYSEIIGDNELVEIGDPLVIKYGGKHLFYSDSADSKEIGLAKYNLDLMKGHLQGLIARHRGHAVQDGTPARGRPITKTTRLPGYPR